MKNGSCLCGAVKFEISGELRPVLSCHCGQCRKTSGHFWAATQVSVDGLKIVSEETLTWFRSSDWAKRGFCSTCGSSLFWKMDEENYISVAAGSLDGPTDLETKAHIFMEDKGDYYEINDGAEQLAKF